MLRPHIGPSLQIAFLMVDALGMVSAAALGAAWRKCLGPQRAARRVAQLIQMGWLEAVTREHGSRAVVRLTAAGQVLAVGGRDPQPCWGRRWDGRWRLVMFDLPETERALRLRLLRQLRCLGFGYLQHSIWVTPDPVDTLRAALSEKALDVETLSFMEARPCGGAGDVDLVAGAWDFVRINRNYEAYLGQLAHRPPRPGDAARRWWEWEWQAWHRALRDDPLLPEPLLPRGYRGREAWAARTAALAAAAATIG